MCESVRKRSCERMSVCVGWMGECECVGEMACAFLYVCVCVYVCVYVSVIE